MEEITMAMTNRSLRLIKAVVILLAGRIERFTC